MIMLRRESSSASPLVEMVESSSQCGSTPRNEVDFDARDELALRERSMYSPRLLGRVHLRR